MNLFGLARRNDRNLALTGKAVPAKLPVLGKKWSGLRITPDDTPQLRLRSAPRWYPFVERPDHVGWQAMGVADGGLPAIPGKSEARIELWFEVADQRIGDVLVINLRDEPVTLPLPWPEGDIPLSLDAELVVQVPATSPHGVFLAICEALDRKPLIGLAKGRGVEIGPGTNPQVRPGSDTRVTYVEQMSSEDWKRLYNEKGKYDLDDRLWDQYRLGDAADLPVEDGSLDFIFSSHVFEHLANPLGHLRRWHGKLARGGLVLGVVPDICGAKDYMFRPCSMDEFLREDQAEDFAPHLGHYQRWVINKKLQTSADELMRSRWSIHVHFYTKGNMTELLKHAVAEIGYSAFEVRHHPNHKDFHFVLRK